MKSSSTALTFRPKLLIQSPSRPSCRTPGLRVLAASSGRDADADDWKFGRGGIVDENMIVLRKRIQEMKMVEKNYEVPVHWMEWEKRYYPSYDSDVCEGVGLLQRFLMNTRPSVALGMLVMVGMSVPAAAILVLINLFVLGKRIVEVIIYH